MDEKSVGKALHTITKLDEALKKVDDPNEEVDNIISNLIADLTKDRWIRTSDRRPGHKQRVWYYFEHVGVHAGAYNADLNQFYGVGGFLTDDVTHWMPLRICTPKAPS